MAYDPFTHRKALPAYPNVWQQPSARDVARIGTKYKAGSSLLSSKPALGESFNYDMVDSLRVPEMPDFGTGSAGPTGPPGSLAFPEVLAGPAMGGSAELPEVVWQNPQAGFGTAREGAGGSQISSTDRYEARQDARGVSRKSPSFNAARRFLRIDGSAPHSSRDTMGSQGDTLRPPPVDFTGRDTGGMKSRGFGATPQDTSAEVQQGFERPDGAQWSKPLGYGDLLKKYSWEKGT